MMLHAYAKYRMCNVFLFCIVNHIKFTLAKDRMIAHNYIAF